MRSLAIVLETRRFCGVITIVRLLILVVPLAACSTPAAPHRAVAPTAALAADGDIDAPAAPAVTSPLPPDRGIQIDWDRAPLTTDAEAVAVWQQILPDGVDWELRLAQIPEKHFAPLAAALLRGGNFACPPLVGGACTPGYLGWPDPAPDARFDEPCLRRAVALWAIDNLDGAQVEALAPTLRGIAGSAQLDDALVDAVLVATRNQPEAIRLDFLRAARDAGHAKAVDDELGGLSELALVTAATELHIDAAIETLDIGQSRPVFLAAVRDRKLQPATRIAAIAELAVEVGDRTVPRDLEKALIEASRDPDCGVAAAAATELVNLGKRDAVPRRPRTRQVSGALRALCVMAAADAVAAAAPFVGPSGLKVIERTYDPDLEFAPDDADTDGDHDPRTERTVETITRPALVAIPFEADLPAVVPHCKASGLTSVCAVPGQGVVLTFTWVNARDGGLWLDTIERHDRGDCGPEAE
jgi:hypothetical protein